MKLAISILAATALLGTCVAANSQSGTNNAPGQMQQTDPRTKTDTDKDVKGGPNTPTMSPVTSSTATAPMTGTAGSSVNDPRTKTDTDKDVKGGPTTPSSSQ